MLGRHFDPIYGRAAPEHNCHLSLHVILWFLEQLTLVGTGIFELQDCHSLPKTERIHAYMCQFIDSSRTM